MTKMEKTKINELILDELNPIIQISNIFNINFNRTIRLLKNSVPVEKFIEGDKGYVKTVYDIIRATIVFLHTSLETTLREILRLRLKFNGDISSIPLASKSGLINRKEKFSLSELAQYRGKNINEVIDDSIDQYLNTVSFNSSSEIANYLVKIEIPQNTLEKYYPLLNEMIERRHKIVHEGDIKRGGFPSELNDVDMDRVVKWFDATSEFCGELIRVAGIAIYLGRIMDRLEQEGIKANKQDVANSIKVKIENKNASNQNT